MMMIIASQAGTLFFDTLQPTLIMTMTARPGETSFHNASVAMFDVKSGDIMEGE